MKEDNSYRKVTVVGAGAVGASIAFTLVQSNLLDEISIIDIAEEKTKGEALDLTDAAAFSGSTKVVGGKEYELCKDADIIVITAGAAQKAGETRLDLVRKNTSIMKSIVSEIIKHNTTALLLLVSNPVDVLATVAMKVSGFDPSKVIGSGTILDTGRSRVALADKLGLHTNQVESYVLGEHGDSQFIPWSLAQVEEKQSDFDALSGEEKEQIAKSVARKAYTIIEKKGATYYGIASAVELIVSHIYEESDEPIPLSTYQDEGVHITCSLVCVTKDGIQKTAVPQLSEPEAGALALSVKNLQSVLDSIKDILDK